MSSESIYIVPSISLAQKGVANGVATLDNNTKVPIAQIPISVLTYKGTWDASVAAGGSPHLQNGTGTNGDMYIVSTGGIQNLGAGNVNYSAGNLVIYDGTTYQMSGSTVPTQVNADWNSISGLSQILNKPDLSGYITTTSTNTLTNKRITKRIGTETTNTSTSINSNLFDQWNITALATNDSISITGTPTDGQDLVIKITSDSGSHALSFSGISVSSNLALPTSTIANKTMWLGLRYSGTNWYLLAFLNNF